MFSLLLSSSDLKVPIIGSTLLGGGGGGLPVAQNFFDLTLYDVKTQGRNKSQAVRVPSVLSLNALNEL